MTFAIWLIGILLAVFVAFVAPWISHSTKISEFRQAWINELRSDIAEYVRLTEKWFRAYSEIIDLPDQDVKQDRERKELFPLSNDAKVILYRIRLRFSPRDNPNKSEDDRFLQSLDDLLNPGKCAPPQPDISWGKLAKSSVEQAREILKREWEVTKKIPQHPLFLWIKNKIVSYRQAKTSV
jgi:hypothetical protein